MLKMPFIKKAIQVKIKEFEEKQAAAVSSTPLTTPKKPLPPATPDDRKEDRENGTEAKQIKVGYFLLTIT